MPVQIAYPIAEVVREIRSWDFGGNAYLLNIFSSKV